MPQATAGTLDVPSRHSVAETIPIARATQFVPVRADSRGQPFDERDSVEVLRRNGLDVLGKGHELPSPVLAKQLLEEALGPFGREERLDPDVPHRQPTVETSAVAAAAVHVPHGISARAVGGERLLNPVEKLPSGQNRHDLHLRGFGVGVHDATGASETCATLAPVLCEPRF